MAEVKISALTVANTLSATDRVVVLTNPASAANVQTITLANFANSFVMTTAVPATNTSSGVAGQLAYNANTLYVCVANNKWGRVTLNLSW